MHVCVCVCASGICFRLSIGTELEVPFSVCIYRILHIKYRPISSFASAACGSMSITKDHLHFSLVCVCVRLWNGFLTSVSVSVSVSVWVSLKLAN